MQLVIGLGLLLIVRFVAPILLAALALTCFAISAASFGLLVWLISNMYKKWYLDLLEASFILNLGILAVATYHVRMTGGNQVAVGYTSAGVAFAKFIAIVLYHIYLQTKGSRFWRVICRKEDRNYQQLIVNVNKLEETVDTGNEAVVAPKYLSYFMEVADKCENLYWKHNRTPCV